MKKMTMAKWEEKYIAGQVERFSQKNISMSRFGWDDEIRIAGFKGVSFELESEVKDKAGQSLLDQAMRFASWMGVMLDLLDTSKPNPPQASKQVSAAIANSGYMLPSYVWRPPEGVELDVSDPQKITRYIKKAAINFGADLVGVCKLDRRFVYSHNYPTPMFDEEQVERPQEIPDEFQYAIVTAHEMEYNMIKHFHTPLAEAAVGLGYSRMGITNMFLSKFISNLGYKAINCATNDVVLAVPLAIQAGLGELGRGGWIITPQFGPRVRLTVVLTDLPLVPDSPIDFGVTEFCEVCKKCAEMCPSQSISYDRRSTEVPNISSSPGALKWPLNGETCAAYWVRTKSDCSYCIGVCPYNKANTWPHKVVRWFADNIRCLDSVYVKMDDLLGYGKIKNPSNFWEEWKSHPYGRSEK